MAILCTMEFLGQERGWRATANLGDGRVVTIAEAQDLAAARRRLKRAVDAAGVDEAEFEEKLRIPHHVQAELAAYHEKNRALAALEAEVQQIRPRLAQRLLTELRLSEREVAAWLRVSHTHISTLLLAHTAETSGEIAVENQDQAERAPTKRRPD